MEKHNKVHVWIGTNFSIKIEYERYFDLDYSTEGDFDDPDYKLCGFCHDVGIKWYDQDFIGIIPRCTTEVDISELLEEAAIDSGERARVEAACSALDISRANAMFWYADGDLELSKPHKGHYNGLTYIGLFEGD